MSKHSLSISIASPEDNGAYESVLNIELASVNVIAYAAKDALAEIEGDKREFTVELSDGLKLTADAGTVGDVLRARVAKLRKAERAAAAPAGE